ncbi:hypothetical protein T484DRAFT_1593594, partial [Baffinella frigidus]
CSDNGRCLHAGTCECDAGFTGPACDVCLPGLFGQTCDTTCDEVDTCNGNGRCSELGQ